MWVARSLFFGRWTFQEKNVRRTTSRRARCRTARWRDVRGSARTGPRVIWSRTVLAVASSVMTRGSDASTRSGVLVSSCSTPSPKDCARRTASASRFCRSYQPRLSNLHEQRELSLLREENHNIFYIVTSRAAHCKTQNQRGAERTVRCVNKRQRFEVASMRSKL